MLVTRVFCWNCRHAPLGGIAQLGERLHGMQEVSGSIPLTSTKKSRSSRGLGHHPFTVSTGVRIPYGTPSFRMVSPSRHCSKSRPVISLRSFSSRHPVACAVLCACGLYPSIARPCGMRASAGTNEHCTRQSYLPCAQSLPYVWDLMGPVTRNAHHSGDMLLPWCLLACSDPGPKVLADFCRES